MAIAITRTSWTDDDGSGTTGTILNNAAKTELYDQIDAVLNATRTANLLFTDATYDIGASGATRPRDLFLSRNAVVGGTLSVGGNVVSNLLFTDATYDIGASGATRPRDLFLSRNAVVGGTLTAAGDVGLAATKKLYFDGVAMTGDTYISESSANTLSLFSGNVEAKLTSGVLTVSGFGTHKFEAGSNSALALSVNNTTSGTAAQGYLQIGAGTVATYFQTFSQDYTTSGTSIQASSLIYASGAGGLSLVAAHASGAIRFYSGGTTRRMLLDTTGVVTMDYYGAGTATFSAAGVISSVSDERLKNDIRPLGYGLAEVLALTPIRYFWTDASGLNDAAHTEYGGFGAANVQAVMPLAVGHDGRGFMTLGDRPILGAVVNATKELYGGWQSHDAELAALRARVEKLEARIALHQAN